MNLLDAILLGAIQGITEFLPISSSGHLVIGNYILGIENDNILFEVFVHLATLTAIIYYYKDDIIKMCRGIIYKERKHKYVNYEIYKYKDNIKKKVYTNILRNSENML